MDWVYNLVAVEKKNGSPQLCLDAGHLNDVIKREHYRIPTILEMVGGLTGKSVFSTFYLKDGYWQVELDEGSSYLCPIAKPFGRYRFIWMPFRLKSASEVFKKRNKEGRFEGIEDIYMVADDIIIAASFVEQHDKILTEVLQRVAARNNFDIHMW